jgi:hypothetical protein
LTLVIIVSLGGAGVFFLQSVPPEKPANLESATGLSASELVEVANKECQRYEEILSSSAAGKDYQSWLDAMSKVLTSEEASSFKRRNAALYDLANNDFSENLQARGALTLQVLILDDEKFDAFQPGTWNASRLEDFYPVTLSTLGWNMANLSLEECGLTDFSRGMRELTREAKQVMQLANSSSKRTSPGNNESQSCGIIKDEITTVRSTFLRGQANPQQISSILNGAASTWQSESRSYSGSKASWLNKMSELSLKLKGFVLTGSPTNGDQLLDQLGANFSLYQQFCE